MERLIIVGSGMAAAQLLKELSQLPERYDIQVIGAESRPSYNRILLSALLSGEKDAADLELMDADWYQRHGITLYIGEAVTAIDVNARSLSTCAGRSAHFDRLVLATGSRPFVPQIPGLDCGKVLVFRSQDDLAAIRQAATQASTAVVIGGGLLGLEAAFGLLKLGLRVTVVNREDWLMPRQMDRTAAQVLQQSLQVQGIDFRLGTTPQRILGTAESVSAVELATGEQLSCSMVLVTAGIVPESSVAKASGIPCNRGVLVNDRLETEISGIYALGECCELNGLTFGLVAPVYEQARVLARVLNHEATARYEHQEAATQLKIAGVSVVSGGQLPFADDCNSQIVLDRSRGIYRRLVYQNRKLTGYILVGDSSHKSLYGDMLESEQADCSAGAGIMFGQSDLVAETRLSG